MDTINQKYEKLLDIQKSRHEEMHTIDTLINTIDTVKLLNQHCQNIIENKLCVFIPLMKINLKNFIELLTKTDCILNHRITSTIRLVPIHFDGLYVNKQMIQTPTDFGYIDYEDANEKYKKIYIDTNKKHSSKLLNSFIDIHPNLICQKEISSNEVENIDLYSQLFFSDLIDNELIKHEINTLEVKELKTGTISEINIDIDETNNYFWSYTHMIECIVLSVN